MSDGARPTVTLSDLNRLRDQDNRPARLTDEEVEDFAVAALVLLRGIRKADKRRVHRRMLKLLDA